MGKDKGGGDEPPIVYQGARGPRKTPPRPKKKKWDPSDRSEPSRSSRSGIKTDDAVVRGLFGDQTADEAIERTSPGAPAQRPGKRVQKRRSKVRMGEKWTRILDEIEASGITMEDFCKTLTPEELARGQLRNDDGSFRGAPTKWVPSEFHRACIRELMTRGKVLYQENYIAAIAAMTTIATDERVEPGQRIRAAQFVIERIEGKVPERLEVGVSEPWQELLVGIVATVPEGTPLRAFDDALEGEAD